MKFEKSPWSQDAEQGLNLTFSGDLAIIKNQVNQGVAELWKINDGQAWFITRVDGNELVIVCAQGSGAIAVGRNIQAQARQLGLNSVRFHTQRPGLAKLLQEFGFVEAERVYRCML